MSREAMDIVDIHQAKTHLSRLVEKAAKGESFIIAKAGRPMVRVVAMDAPDMTKTKRIGFMIGELRTPDDFDHMGEGVIDALFSDEATRLTGRPADLHRPS